MPPDRAQWPSPAGGPPRRLVTAAARRYPVWWPSAAIQMSLLMLLLPVQMSLVSAARPVRQAAGVAELIASETGAARQTCEAGAYECVPFYHCDTANIVTDGAGLLDIRFGGELTENAKQSPTRTHSECEDFLDVCCSRPRLKRTESLLQRQPYQPRCGQRNPDGLDVRILGFKHGESQFGEYPWQVAITRVSRNGETLFVGGGSLIHRQVVLTAAHSVRSFRGLEVRMGEWDTQHTTEVYPHLNVPVTRVVKHPQFNGGNLHNDIALLILAAPVDMRPHMDTVCLPDHTFTPRADCVVTGWGKNAFGSSGYQTVLKAISVPAVSSADCERALQRTRLGPKFRLDESFMCAGGRQGEDACTGDGGSALVCEDPAAPGRYVQLGIVAWGVGCGAAGRPGVYTDVRRFVDWIHQEMALAGV